MTKLNKRYVIGTHVMFFEIEMYSDFIKGLVNLLETVENKENVIIDLCFNMNEVLEKIDCNKISRGELTDKFYEGVNTIKELGYKVNTRVIGLGEFYFHADYRRDLNYNYCKKVDYVMWGETDSFFPKEAFQALESLSKYTDEQNIHRYIMSFADRKMWDSSWDPTVHVDYEHLEYIDDENHHLHKTQAKSQLTIEEMNEINSKVEDFDFRYINYPKIDGSCLVISSDLIKSGVNIPLCLIYNDDEGLAVMAQKLCGDNFIQFICKNLLKVHARRHVNKRLYVLDEDNPNSFDDRKPSSFVKFKQMSQTNISNLIQGKNKFYEYDDFEK
jgi:hypothetical protein|tara:strand:+ start:2630 stop:3616 length:987 start_codon:yes stop_codon:yes gene_type:complete